MTWPAAAAWWPVEFLFLVANNGAVVLCFLLPALSRYGTSKFDCRPLFLLVDLKQFVCTLRHSYWLSDSLCLSGAISTLPLVFDSVSRSDIVVESTDSAVNVVYFNISFILNSFLINRTSLTQFEPS